MALDFHPPSRKPYEDHDFFGESALGDVSVQQWRKPFKWLRASQLQKEPKLFTTVQADNISQGELGDCWLLASLAVLADFPGHIHNIFEEKVASPDGKYTIHLYDLKAGWQDVEIDDKIPCDKNGKPLFAQLNGENGAFWPLLLEKAIAKFAGSYKRLSGGSATWAWQVLTGQKNQTMWMRQEKCKGDHDWRRWELAKLKDFLKDPDQWRREGMKKLRWSSTEDTMDDLSFFSALATYAQANFPISCAIDEGGEEEERTDGLLCRHEYSVLQVVCAERQKLVQVRNPWGKGGEWNGDWSDASDKWNKHPTLKADLAAVDSDDGRFWMPWASFAAIFGNCVSVCPVTLPCPRNSQLTEDKSVKRRCPKCRQPYTRSWVLLVEGTWHRFEDTDLCYLCLRSTCRATRTDLRIAGVHCQPDLTLAPPPAPRRLEVCKYGAACYRRNPTHFHDCFHPSLLPPAPECENGCGRCSASGFTTCCKMCSEHPPSLKVTIPEHCSVHKLLSGRYEAVEGKRSNGSPVWRKPGVDAWLWRGSVWMFGDERSVGGQSGFVGAKGPSPSPHLVSSWQAASKSGWEETPEMRVQVIPGTGTREHASYCSDRSKREEALAHEADEVLESHRKHLASK